MITGERPAAVHAPPVRASAVEAAYQRVVDLYRVARLEVFDRYPRGMPPAEALEPFESSRLEQLRQAEEELDDLRRRWHAGGGAVRPAG